MANEYPVASIIRSMEHYIGRMIGLYWPKTLDNAVLNAFQKELPVAAREVLARQIRIFNHYRHLRSRAGYASSFGYYRGLSFKDVGSECKLDFYVPQEIPIASAKISSHRDDFYQAVRVDLFVFRGEYRSLKYDLSPKIIFNSYNPAIDDIRISDIDILFDPMNPDPFPTSESNDIENPPEWLRSLLIKCPGATISTPLSASLRNKLINYHGLPFPDDYLELVSFAEHIECPHSFEIFGLSKMHFYMTPSNYIVLLGEVIGEGFLGLLRNATPGIYFIDHEWDHIPIHMGNSLEAALCRVLDEGQDKIVDSSKEYNE